MLGPLQTGPLLLSRLGCYCCKDFGSRAKAESNDRVHKEESIETHAKERVVLRVNFHYSVGIFDVNLG